MCLDSLKDSGVIIAVDTEGLFSHQVLTCIDDVNVKLLVKIVGNGAVNCVDIVLLKKLVIVGGAVLYRIKIVGKVSACVLGEIANSDDLGAGDGTVGKLTPACCRASKLTAHQSAAYNGKADGLFLIAHLKNTFLYNVFIFLLYIHRRSGDYRFSPIITRVDGGGGVG
jgi:hypothetical protein